MSTEKIIKQQSKASLSGNWTVIIAAVFVILTVIIFADAVFSAVCYNANILNSYSGVVYDSKQFEYYIAVLVYYSFAVLASPLLNGLIKMICSISLYSRAEIFDLFFFFRGARRYFKTVFINTALFFIYSVISYGLDVYSYVCSYYGESLGRQFSFDAVTLTLLGAFLISAIIKTAIFLLFAYYPLTAYSFNNNLHTATYIFGFMGFSFRNFINSAKLAISFTGWIVLSCAFAVPAIYALPYIAVSAVTSAKWLFALERNYGVIC